MTELLAHPPSEDELARLYWELAKRGAPAGGAPREWPYDPSSPEELAALAADMSRYDPRLITILVSWITARWTELNPLALRLAMKRMTTPQALCVIVTFVRRATTDAELRAFVDYVCSGWSAVSPTERFFFDVERPHTKLAERRLGQSLLEYSRWGFVGLERPQLDVFRKHAIGTYDLRTRLRVLRRLAQRHREIRLSDYLAEIDHSVSPTMAARDARAAGLLQRGQKRGSRWVWPRPGTIVRLDPGEIEARGPRGESVLHLDRTRLATVISEPDEDRWISLTLHAPDAARPKARTTHHWKVRVNNVACAIESAPPASTRT